MKEATKLKVATAATVLFLGAISAAGLANRGGDAGAAEPATQASQPAATTSAAPESAVVLPLSSEDDDEGYEDDEGFEDDEGYGDD